MLSNRRQMRARQLVFLALSSACLVAGSAGVRAQAPDESAVLAQVKGTVYVRPLQTVEAGGYRRCGFEFLLIGSEPATGRALQLKAEFFASALVSGKRDGVYGWSGVVFEGLQAGAPARPAGRISFQPVNGMRVDPLPASATPGGDRIEYQAPIGPDFQVLLASIVRDRGLKVAYSRTADSALIETTLDMDVASMELVKGKAVREFDSRVPLAMSRCWSPGQG